MSPVGYKNPPKQHQFRPGKSGNPSGRPKKIKSIAEEVLEALGEMTRILRDGHQIQATKAAAIASKLIDRAIDGDMRATNSILSLSNESNRDQVAGDNSQADLDIVEDLIAREMRRRETKTDDRADASEQEQRR